MPLKKVFQQLNIFAECRRYDIPIKQCPSFLFVIMGLVIIAAMLITYYIGVHYMSPEILIMVLAVVTIVLLLVGHTIVVSFERIVQANRMKSEFVSIVSHQLRTPLSSLKWSLDLLRGKRIGEINKKQKEYLNIINESNNRMIKLVNDLLNVNRIEEGKLGVKPNEFFLVSLVEDIIEEIKPLAQENKVTVSLHKEESLPSVYADTDRIRMVIQNLIENAIKYSNKDIKDRLAEITIERDGDRVKFSIKDNGVGIPSGLQGQVFGKFFRGNNLAKRRVEGTGLGLFITRGIIKLSGGEIDFKSKEGKGSTFWFTLPIAKNNK
jgi:signal transduction histidine kinase